MKQVTGKLRVLVVDDEEDLLFLMEAILWQEGYAVRLCHNARNLDTCISEWQPHLVLLDLRMSEADGEQICRDLKDDPATKSILIILFSANYDIEAIAKECGADECLQKPFDISIAREKFKKVLRNAGFEDDLPGRA